MTDAAAEALLDRSRPLVGVGMKMYLGYERSLQYLADVAGAADALRAVSLFVLPSFPVLPAARDLLAGTGIAYGAQDGHWEDAGPHTGSVSAAMLAELGCSLVEVGHAERRRDFGEDDAMTARKAAAAARSGLVPLVCVGERDPAASADTVVRHQVSAVLQELDDAAPVMIAYEPVWAIGAEAPATPAHIEPVLRAVRTVAAGRAGALGVVYGGGVMAEEIGSILTAGADGIFASRSTLTLSRLERVVEHVALWA